MPPVEFDRLARAEVRRAQRYLARNSSSRTAARFAVAIDDAVGRIASSPLAFPLDRHGTRVCQVKRFQYHIVYLVEPTRVAVIAVSHNRRRPGYWVRRLPSP